VTQDDVVPSPNLDSKSILHVKRDGQLRLHDVARQAGTTSTAKFHSRAAATVFICTNAISLPRHVRGPALKEMNL
jgi:hypothetical protein